MEPMAFASAPPFIGTSAPSTAPMQPIPQPAAPSSASRYEALLQQIVQLNTDLQKTAALSQSLQRERDGLQHNNHKLKDEVKRLHERCDKLQQVLMTETEQKIESDKKHEELIAKWKKQLELKARAFENLQKKFAPPRDLEQLRLQIQEELEEPHQQRIEGLQEEIEKQRQLAFNLRREYEVLKTEYEQFMIDQGNEMECLHASYELKVADLRKKWVVADEKARDSQNTESIRRLEHEKDAARIQIKSLQDEIQDLRDDLDRAHASATSVKAVHEVRIADEMTRFTNLDLDHKALIRQMARSREEAESVRAKWDQAQTKLLELSTESDKLRDQLKQKDQLIQNSHQATTTKLRDEREVWEREKQALTERLREHAMKLQAAEMVLTQVKHKPSRGNNNNERDEECDDEGLVQQHAMQLKARDADVDKYRNQATNLERALAQKEDELQRLQLKMDEAIHKLKTEKEQLTQTMQMLEVERDQVLSKQTATNELLSKVKGECILLRTKLKEVEMDYRTLQAKHREMMQFHEEMQLEKQQVEAKLKFVETDCMTLRETLEKEKEDHLATTRDLQRQCARLESDARAQQNTLREEMKAALSKALRELGHTQKKRDAYKQKCLQVHERYKSLMEELQRYDARLLQLKQEHSVELQQLLSQLTALENDKTMLLQHQLGLGSG